MDENKKQLISTIQKWAPFQPDLIAMALVGSCARGTDTDTSDIDLVLITNDPLRYLRSDAWASDFGEIHRSQIERYSKVTSLRAFYRDGPEVEFGITTPDWITLPLDPGTRQVLKDGTVVLFERSNELTTAIRSL